MNTIKDFTAHDISLTDCTAYQADRGNAFWANATEAEQQAAIYRAFDYIRVQPFRDDIDIFAEGLPLDIEQATYEAALVEIQIPGALLATLTKEDLVTEKKIDVITTKYLSGASVQYRKIDALLKPYLATAMVSLSR